MSSYCKIPYLIRHKNSKIYWYNQIYFCKIPNFKWCNICKIPNFKWRNICKIPNFDWKWQSYFFVLGATGWWPTFLYGDAEEWRAAPEGWGQWPILRLLLRRGRCRLTTACKGCRRDKPQYAAREWLHWSGDRAICHIRTAATGYRIRQIGIVSYDSRNYQGRRQKQSSPFFAFIIIVFRTLIAIAFLVLDTVKNLYKYLLKTRRIFFEIFFACKYRKIRHFKLFWVKLLIISDLSRYLAKMAVL